MKSKVYYTKKEYSRDYMMGTEFMVDENIEFPDSNNIEKTHVLLIETEETNLEKIYTMMQGENWSPLGEARDMILSLGLSHTSMSIGDIVQVGEEFHMVDTWGFTDITHVGTNLPDSEVERLAKEDKNLTDYENRTTV